LHHSLRVTASIGVAGGFEERAMSTIGASSSNNPYANIQMLWKRGQAQSQSGAAQGDAPSQTFGATTSPQAANAPASPTAAPPSGKTSTSGGTFPRFEPQTLQALLAVQTTGN
jgi:hypothetical protein